MEGSAADEKIMAWIAGQMWKQWGSGECDPAGKDLSATHTKLLGEWPGGEKCGGVQHMTKGVPWRGGPVNARAADNLSLKAQTSC